MLVKKKNSDNLAVKVRFSESLQTNAVEHFRSET